MIMTGIIIGFVASVVFGVVCAFMAVHAFVQLRTYRIAVGLAGTILEVISQRYPDVNVKECVPIAEALYKERSDMEHGKRD